MAVMLRISYCQRPRHSAPPRARVHHRVDSRVAGVMACATPDWKKRSFSSRLARACRDVRERLGPPLVTCRLSSAGVARLRLRGYEIKHASFMPLHARVGDDCERLISCCERLISIARVRLLRKRCRLPTLVRLARTRGDIRERLGEHTKLISMWARWLHRLVRRIIVAHQGRACTRSWPNPSRIAG
jgi:hypothetical protein